MEKCEVGSASASRKRCLITILSDFQSCDVGYNQPMRRLTQETREEKIGRRILNLTRALELAPSLNCLRVRKAELEARLYRMPLAEKQALVPWEETRRETKESIATYNELIADLQKELRVKKQDIKRQTAELLGIRAKLKRNLLRLANRATSYPPPGLIFHSFRGYDKTITE